VLETVLLSHWNDDMRASSSLHVVVADEPRRRDTAATSQASVLEAIQKRRIGNAPAAAASPVVPQAAPSALPPVLGVEEAKRVISARPPAALLALGHAASGRLDTSTEGTWREPASVTCGFADGPGLVELFAASPKGLRRMHEKVVRESF
jgi:hypothetical protein